MADPQIIEKMKRADTKKNHKKAVFIMILVLSGAFTGISYITEGKWDISEILIMAMLISVLLFAGYFLYMLMRYYINCADEFIKSLKGTDLSRSEDTRKHTTRLLWLYLLFRSR